MVGGEVSEGLGPERLIVAVGEKLGSGPGGDPRAVAEFAFQLTFRPTGVADKSAYQGTGILGMFDGVGGRDPGSKAQPLLLGPPESGKGEMFAGNRPTDMNINPGECSKLLILEKLAHFVAGGMIEDEAVGSLLGIVFCQKDHGVREDALAQGGIGEKKLPLEADG